MSRGSSKVKSLLIIVIVLVLAVIGGKFILQKAFPPSDYDSYIVEAANKYNVSPYTLLSVIKLRSGFDAEKTSSSDPTRYGLMQITEEAWKANAFKAYVDGNKYTDPEKNIKVGTYILSSLMKKYGDERTALAAFYIGEATVDGWLADLPTASGDKKTLDDIPESDVNHFCKEVKNYERIYGFLYKNMESSSTTSKAS